jgi:hypothetical protein
MGLPGKEKAARGSQELCAACFLHPQGENRKKIHYQEKYFQKALDCSPGAQPIL